MVCPKGNTGGNKPQWKQITWYFNKLTIHTFLFTGACFPLYSPLGIPKFMKPALRNQMFLGCKWLYLNNFTLNISLIYVTSVIIVLEIFLSVALKFLIFTIMFRISSICYLPPFFCLLKWSVTNLFPFPYGNSTTW